MTAATEPGDPRPLGRLPALDGLRGVAILLVLASHFGVPSTRGAGSVGVLIFFVLSGFLITSLLVREEARSGRIDLWAFYQRRARRLLPALALVLLATLGAALVLGELATVGPQAFRAALYHANTAPVVEPLGHAWTLSVEEQYYVAWPLLVVLLPMRWVASFAFVVAVVMLPGEYHLSAFGAIAAGSALGAVRPRAWPAWTAVPAAGVVGLAAMIPLGSFFLEWLRLAVVAASLVLVLVALRPVPLLSSVPLRYVGRISYGLYLWHIPVRWTLTELGVTDLPLMALGLGLSFGIAALSWHYLEQPILSYRKTVLADDDHLRAAARSGGSTA